MFALLEFKDCIYYKRTKYSKVKSADKSVIDKKYLMFFDNNDWNLNAFINLISVKIPEDTKKLNICAFQDCFNLENIILPYGLTSIGDFAFANCANLKEIEIPKSVTSIGKMAFSACVKLKHINIGNVSFIDKFAFKACSSLESITWNDKIFRNKDELNSALINSGVTTDNIWI